NDSEERTYTVEVTYTDASGSTVTSSGSATATIATAPTLTLTGSGIQTEGGRQFLVLKKSASAVRVTAEVLCYGGTVTYTWANEGVGLSLIPVPGEYKDLTPTDGGKATVTVQASFTDGTGTSRTLSKQLDVYVLDVRIGGADVPASAADPVVISDAATDSTTLTASLWDIGSDLAGLSGVTYSWTVANTSFATSTPATGASTTIRPVAAGTTTVQVTASYKGVTSDPCVRALNVAGLMVSCGSTALTDGMAVQKSDTGKSLTAAVTGYSGSGSLTFDWMSTGTALDPVTGDGTNKPLSPSAGGKSTVTVSTTVGSRTLSKSVDVYVLDVVLGGAGLPANASDPIVIVNSATDSAALSMSLAGFASAPSGVTYEWVIADETLASTSTPFAATATVVPHDTGTTTVKAQISYRGVTAESATRTINVAGLKITGSKIFTKGAAGKTLPTEFEGFATAPTVTSWTWSSGTETVATASGSTGTASLGLLAGGKTTVSVDAVVGGKTLHAEKDIYVLDLVVDIPAGTELDGSGNPKLALGDTLDLTASLAGLTDADLTELGVTFSWGSQTPAAATVDPADEAATTVIPIADDTSVVIRAMVWYLGANTLATDTTVVIPEGLPLANVTNYLKNLPAITTSDPPYVVPAITGLTKDNWTQIKDALTASTSADRYVDLSGITLPDDITTLYQGFKYCTTLVKSPQLPASMTGGNVAECFWGCTNLTTAPAVPDGITSMYYCFQSCSKLADLSALTIPNGVTNMEGCFGGCSSLTDADVSALTIPNSVTRMRYCFSSCTGLTDLSGLTLPNNVGNLEGCFSGCSNLTNISGLTIPGSVTTMQSCFEGCTKLTDVSGLSIPNSVTDMRECFSYCYGLTRAPVIPAGVDSMQECFSYCTELGGTITIQTTATTGKNDWRDCFKFCKADKIDAICVPNSSIESQIHWANGTSDELAGKIVYP
ncbi:MAG: leucine-rich repeat protein, partial [Treponema sp.]|nr:leucine-rich repeat protein [Treponema sp.]